MTILNVGIIGTGGIGWAHAQGLRGSPERFRLRAASDTNPQGLERFCAAHGITERHADYRSLLADPAIDAVVVLLPHHLHLEACEDAFAAGKHVLVEKPISRTLEEADRIIAAGRRQRRTLMVGHNQRYDGRHRGIRRHLEAGAIGEVFSARIDHFQHFNPPAGSWWRSLDAVGGGCVIGSGIHRLDLLRWYLGEAAEIYAQLSFDPTRLEGEVACAATIRFHGGAHAEFLCNWGVHRASHGESLMLFGRNGSLTVTGGDPGIQFLPPAHQPERLVDEPRSMWDHFHECILTGQEPLTSGAEGRASLQLVLAVVQAGRAGAPLRLAADGSILAPSAVAARPQLAGAVG
jgi:predicted dehydrogenase